jgi:hypothetical protein
MNMAKELDVYKIDVDKDDESGIKAMSLVSRPAIESNFLRFEKAKKPSRVVALKDENGEYKQVLAGLALVPDKLIYRYDPQNEYEYFVYFDVLGIERIRDKFHKDKATDVVNLQHSDEVVDAYLIESYIINSEERLAEVQSQGIEDAQMGAWYVQYKVEDVDTFEMALSGELNGFSIEIQGNYTLDGMVNLNKNNNKNSKVMGKFNQLINKFKQVLTEFEEVTARIADTETQVIYAEVGEPVYQLVASKEEGGEPTRELVVEGTYILDNGKSVVVDDKGNLIEIKEDEAPVEPVSDENLEKDKVNLQEPVVDEAPAATEAAEPVSETTEAPAEETATQAVVSGIEALIPKDEQGGMLDGSYSIEVYVNNGVVTYGTMYAYTYKDLELSQQKVIELNAEVEKLKAEPLVKPVNVVKEVSNLNKLSKEDVKKMNNLEYQLIRHGLK